MTKREAAKLACRFLSVYLVAYAIISIPDIIAKLGLLGSSSEDSYNLFLMSLWTSVAYFALKLLFGILLWVKADVIAARMYSDSPPADSDMTLTSRDYLAVGITLIGVYLAAIGLPNLVAMIIGIWQNARDQGVSIGELLRTSHGAPDSFWRMIVMLILGVMLAVWGRKLAELLYGRSASSEAERGE